MTCRHASITTYVDDGAAGRPFRMWACADCKRRFYPACEVCVSVGHRNEVHEPLAPIECPHGASWDGSIWTRVRPDDLEARARRPYDGRDGSIEITQSEEDALVAEQDKAAKGGEEDEWWFANR